MPSTTIDIYRLCSSLLSTLILPMSIVVLVDYSWGWMPLLTIIASLILIPLSSLIVVRTILAELDRIIESVAPVEPEDANCW